MVLGILVFLFTRTDDCVIQLALVETFDVFPSRASDMILPMTVQPWQFLGPRNPTEVGNSMVPPIEILVHLYLALLVPYNGIELILLALPHE